MRIPRLQSPSATRSAFTALALAALTFACASAPEEPPPEPKKTIDLVDVGLTFTAIPKGFKVSHKSGSELELENGDEEAGGRMWIELEDPSDFGIDLVKIVTEQTDVYAALPESEYFGGRKIVVAAAGEAYYVRGRYKEGDALLEHSKIFLVHPGENRLVSIHYRYPAGEDSSERIQELFILAGEIGALGGDLGEESGAADAPS